VTALEPSRGGLGPVPRPAAGGGGGRRRGRGYSSPPAALSHPSDYRARCVSRSDLLRAGGSLAVPAELVRLTVTRSL
jgi:hypothetical protein